ncbi:MAG: zf-TFIIB domain-containing protein [Pseudolabrys sp.]
MIEPLKLVPPKTCPVCQIVEIQATETQGRLVYRCTRCGMTMNIAKSNSRRRDVTHGFIVTALIIPLAMAWVTPPRPGWLSRSFHSRRLIPPSRHRHLISSAYLFAESSFIVAFSLPLEG